MCCGGPSNREFSYVACLYEFSSGANYTLPAFTGVSKGGTATSPSNVQRSPPEYGRDA